jgi:hypothetical protein
MPDWTRADMRASRLVPHRPGTLPDDTRVSTPT